MAMTFDPAQASAVDMILKDVAGAEPARMFGMPCYKVKGKMVVGLYETGVVVKVGKAKAADLIRAGKTESFEPMPGRVWKDWVLLTGDIDEYSELIKEAVEAAKKA